jgi:acetyl esterase
MRGVLERMARAGHPPLHTVPARQAKAAYALGAEVLDVPRVALARVEDFTLPARDGHLLPARLYAPSSAVLPVLLYFHGGGFTVGSINTHDILCRELCRLSGAAVVSLDYRLAPAHQFPTAAEDCWDALVWIAKFATQLGLDAGINGARIAVGGDSAGGTLAIQCALRARDAGMALALQLLFYPGCAAHQDTPSHRRFASGFVLDAPAITWFFTHYIRTEADREDWRFAPLLADDFSHLPPAWIGLAECDPLVDEGVQYGDALRAAGVAVDLEIYRGVVHEFIKMGRAIPEAKQAHADAAKALRHGLKIL